MTGIDKSAAMNQRMKTANLHLDLVRNPTSLNGWTTTIYLNKESFKINKLFFDISG
jgi:hypothetical protein